MSAGRRQGNAGRADICRPRHATVTYPTCPRSTVKAAARVCVEFKWFGWWWWWPPDLLQSFVVSNQESETAPTTELNNILKNNAESPHVPSPKTTPTPTQSHLRSICNQNNPRPHQNTPLRAYPSSRDGPSAPPSTLPSTLHVLVPSLTCTPMPTGLWRMLELRASGIG